MQEWMENAVNLVHIGQPLILITRHWNFSAYLLLVNHTKLFPDSVNIIIENTCEVISLNKYCLWLDNTSNASNASYLSAIYIT